MQKQKEEKVLLKCIVKDCNSKVLVTLKTVNIEDSIIQFFNMCYFHKKQFKNKIKEIKEYNKTLSKIRIKIEHVFAKLKRFKILTLKYRNKIRRFALRFNLIAGIYNFELN